MPCAAGKLPPAHRVEALAPGPALAVEPGEPTVDKAARSIAELTGHDE